MSYYIYDSNGYVGDLCSNNGLNELKRDVKGKLFSKLFHDGNIDISDEFKEALNNLESVNKTVANFKSLCKKSEDIVIITDGIFDTEEKSIDKGLTPDQKRLHWEAYAKKTERQEEVFKKVFDNVFSEQKDLVIAEIERTGQLPTLIDENTAKRFEPAIELVYHDAFESAV